MSCRGWSGITVITRGSALGARRDHRRPARGRPAARRALRAAGRRPSRGDRLRIITELSETEGGAVLRTDRHEGEAADLFALQDRIAERVVTTIAPEVRGWELLRALRKPPASLTAYDLVLRALDQMRHLDRELRMERGRAMLEQAVAADRGHGLAYSHLGWWYVFWVAQGWSHDIAADQAAATRAASAALERDRNDALALAARGLLVGHVDRDLDLAGAWWTRPSPPARVARWPGAAAPPSTTGARTARRRWPGRSAPCASPRLSPRLPARAPSVPGALHRRQLGPGDRLGPRLRCVEPAAPGDPGGRSSRASSPPAGWPRPARPPNGFSNWIRALPCGGSSCAPRCRRSRGPGSLACFARLACPTRASSAPPRRKRPSPWHPLRGPCRRFRHSFVALSGAEAPVAIG